MDLLLLLLTSLNKKRVIPISIGLTFYSPFPQWYYAIQSIYQLKTTIDDNSIQLFLYWGVQYRILARNHQRYSRFLFFLFSMKLFELQMNLFKWRDESHILFEGFFLLKNSLKMNFKCWFCWAWSSFWYYERLNWIDFVMNQSISTEWKTDWLNGNEWFEICERRNFAQKHSIDSNNLENPLKFKFLSPEHIAVENLKKKIIFLSSKEWIRDCIVRTISFSKKNHLWHF